MPTALFLSPHFDDVAFSCGATFVRLVSLGWRCVLATAFTRSVPRPSGFALACQLDKGLGPEVDYMRLRRAEDDAFASIAGASVVRRLDFAEAPHRGYGSAAELFQPPRAGDAVAKPLGEALRGLAWRWRPKVVFAPSALGGHVDHVQLRDAARSLVPGLAPGERLLHYRDLPYALRDSAGADRGVPCAVAVGARALDTKLEACSAYRSQLGFQFGDETAMHERLRAFAAIEGRAAGIDGPAERFTIVA